jgi:hypothetical protein
VTLFWEQKSLETTSTNTQVVHSIEYGGDSMDTEDIRKRQSELVTRLSQQLSPQELADASQELEELARQLEKRT